MSFEFPFEYAILPHIGKLFYPMVRLQLHTVNGWHTFSFLVDTGADISTIPTELLPILGIDVKKLTTSEVQGVGGYVLKTYDFSLPIKIGTDELMVHASAIESKHDTQPFLLGRKDIFEATYSLKLDSKRLVTIISRNH